MASGVTPIKLRYLFGVNCYLVAAAGGFVLIDTGVSRRRAVLETELRAAGCQPGSLRLIVLTHAHTDHLGNCAFLKREYGAPIAMHPADVGKVERGDMFWSAAGGRSVVTQVVRAALLLVGLGRFEAFRPDILLGDGQSLGEYGLEARVIHLPGHSPGSIGVLCDNGDFFCGDLLINTGRPEPNSNGEDVSDLNASVEALAGLEIATVYPGHGEPFPIAALCGHRAAG